MFAQGEALAFGGRLGLEWDGMIDALSRSVVGSPLLAYKTEMLKARDWTAAADVEGFCDPDQLARALVGRHATGRPAATTSWSVGRFDAFLMSQLTGDVSARVFR